jgi:hypothetical protein
VLMVFGLPTAQEDHAQRAVLAVLGLQQRLQQGRPAQVGARTPGWPVQMGVHTGPVAVGGLNGDEAATLAVVGETVTHAMALQDAAAPGVILCSAATARLLRGMVRLEAMALVASPRLPPPVYRIVGLRPRHAPIGGRGEHPLTPFVGRHQELATLDRLLAQVGAGRGPVVGIVGEPGLGKSRLLSEFRHSLRQRRLTYLAAGCLSYTPRRPPMGPYASFSGAIAASPQPTRRRPSVPRCTGGSQR